MAGARGIERTIAGNVRQLREARGMTLADLAGMLTRVSGGDAPGAAPANVWSLNLVSRLETGKRRITVDDAYRLCGALRVTLFDLLRIDDGDKAADPTFELLFGMPAEAADDIAGHVDGLSRLRRETASAVSATANLWSEQAGGMTWTEAAKCVAETHDLDDDVRLRLADWARWSDQGRMD